MNQLTVVIITFNEERNIARCLQSIHTIADEVVVVDSLSTDRTQEICEQFGVRFVSHPWEGYIRQKNYANSLSSNDLILSIDADEVLSEELQASVAELKIQSVENKVFVMRRLMNYCGTWIRHGGWYPDKKVRIFDRRYVRWQGQKVHETLSIPETFERVELNGDLLHYSFYTIEEHRAQIEKFAKLSAEEAIASGKRVTKTDAYVHAGWKFIRDYFFKAGFLDGRNGWLISKINAHGVLQKYLNIIDLSKYENRN